MSSDRQTSSEAPTSATSVSAANTLRASMGESIETILQLAQAAYQTESNLPNNEKTSALESVISGLSSVCDERAALDLCPAMVAYVNAEHEFRFANSSFANCFGESPASIVGKHVSRTFPAELMNRLQQYLQDVGSGQKQEFDISFVSGQGKSRWVYANLIPDFDSAGSVNGFLVFLQEVCHRKGVERLRERFVYALDQGMEGFALHDNNGSFTYINDAEAQMYGFDSDELIGQSWKRLYSPEVVAEIEQLHFPVLMAKGKWRGELVGRKKNGDSFDVEVSLTLLTDEANQPDGLVCTCRDITERKSAERHLRQLQRIDALGQLTGGVAHDFNNLLAVIIANLELIRYTSKDTNVLDLAEQAISASERGAALTNRLLAFARKQVLAPVALDVGELISGMMDMMSRTLGEQFTVELDCEDGLWHCITDQSQLENAILNLVLNSRDAMPRGGVIRIQVMNNDSEVGPQGDHEHVQISVCDQGCGMDETTLQRIFDPFFTTKASGNGTGLGLSMVHGFVSQTGGFVRASSEVGRGTCVSLFLLKSAILDDLVVEQEESFAAGNSETILLVEDDSNLRTALANMLRRLQYKVLVTKDVSEAFTVLEKQQGIDLVLSDVVLPDGQSGTELLKKSAQASNAPKIVLMSGYSEVNVPTHVPMLTKPFSLKKLAQTLSATLRC